MRVFAIGATGFIGSVIVQEHTISGHEVVTSDLRQDGWRAGQRPDKVLALVAGGVKEEPVPCPRCAASVTIEQPRRTALG